MVLRRERDMKTDKQIKKEATSAEYRRVYDDMALPPRDIVAECSDGVWVRRAWQSLNRFGWGRWIKAGG